MYHELILKKLVLEQKTFCTDPSLFVPTTIYFSNWPYVRNNNRLLVLKKISFELDEVRVKHATVGMLFCVWTKVGLLCMW